MPSSAGAIYAAAIDHELQKERDRKASLEERAMAVVSTSGILVSLLFAFLAALGKPATLGVGAKLSLAAAMTMFVLACVWSLLVNKPQSYTPLGVKSDMERMVTDEYWNAPADDAILALAKFRLREVDTWRNNNGAKARNLHRAFASESFAVFLLAVSLLQLIA